MRIYMVFNFEISALGILSIWLIILSFLFWRILSHYNRLTKGASSKTLKDVLEDLLRGAVITKKEIESLKARCDRIEREGLVHIQKIGLLRFNPFKDTGGNQSFILSLVDANDTGVVISGLYSRSGTRWYAKKVIEGRGVEYELSEEEKKALKEARKAELPHG